MLWKCYFSMSAFHISCYEELSMLLEFAFLKYVSNILVIFFNPPVAIQNLVTPVAIQNLVTPVATPRSVRLGFLNPSGHTTVCQTGFFPNTFCTWTSKVIPQSHRPVFFSASNHTTVCQTGFFKIFETWASRTIPRSHKPGHWHPRSKKW